MPPPDSPTPTEESRLRRLLAEARVDEPMPEDVASRLEDTLAELGRTRAADPSPEVVPLDRDRRRRRALTGMLAAAAVVLVAGVGVAEVLNSEGVDSLQTTESVDGATDAGDAVEREAAEGSAAGDDLASLDRAPEDGSSLERRNLPVRVRTVGGPLPTIAEERLARDAQRVRRSLPDRAAARHDRAVLFAPKGFTCVAENWGAGLFVGVRYAGSNAVLALRQPSRQNQIAEILQCGTGATLRSVTLRAP